MEGLLFLGIAAGIIALGSLVVWLRYRRPKEPEFNSIDAFRRDMDRLAPPGSGRQRGSRF